MGLDGLDQCFHHPFYHPIFVLPEIIFSNSIAKKTIDELAITTKNSYRVKDSVLNTG